MAYFFLVILVAAAASAWWNAQRAAAEQAQALSHDICHEAHVQWLDQSVHVFACKVYRNRRGWLAIERTYRFDYSYDGVGRHTGEIVLRAGRLVAFRGPERRSQTNTSSLFEQESANCLIQEGTIAHDTPKQQATSSPDRHSRSRDR